MNCISHKRRAINSLQQPRDSNPEDLGKHEKVWEIAKCNCHRLQVEDNCRATWHHDLDYPLTIHHPRGLIIFSAFSVICLSIFRDPLKMFLRPAGLLNVEMCGKIAVEHVRHCSRQKIWKARGTSRETQSQSHIEGMIKKKKKKKILSNSHLWNVMLIRHLI